MCTNIAGMGGVISVFKSKTLRLHTTRSWDFMGLTLNDGEPRLAPLQWAYGGDIVIGIFDTGFLVHTLLSLSPLLHQFYSCTSSCFILPHLYEASSSTQKMNPSMIRGCYLMHANDAMKYPPILPYPSWRVMKIMLQVATLLWFCSSCLISSSFDFQT